MGIQQILKYITMGFRLVDRLEDLRETGLTDSIPGRTAAWLRWAPPFRQAAPQDTMHSATRADFLPRIPHTRSGLPTQNTAHTERTSYPEYRTHGADFLPGIPHTTERDSTHSAPTKAHQEGMLIIILIHPSSFNKFSPSSFNKSSPSSLNLQSIQSSIPALKKMICVSACRYSLSDIALSIV